MPKLPISNCMETINKQESDHNKPFFRTVAFKVCTAVLTLLMGAATLGYKAYLDTRTSLVKKEFDLFFTEIEELQPLADKYSSDIIAQAIIQKQFVGAMQQWITHYSEPNAEELLSYCQVLQKTQEQMTKNLQESCSKLKEAEQKTAKQSQELGILLGKDKERGLRGNDLDQDNRKRFDALDKERAAILQKYGVPDGMDLCSQVMSDMRTVVTAAPVNGGNDVPLDVPAIIDRWAIWSDALLELSQKQSEAQAEVHTNTINYFLGLREIYATELNKRFQQGFLVRLMHFAS